MGVQAALALSLHSLAVCAARVAQTTFKGRQRLAPPMTGCFTNHAPAQQEQGSTQPAGLLQCDVTS